MLEEKKVPVELTERHFQVLRLTVQAYLKTYEPVASRVVSRLMGSVLSPSTIRNVMADLEEAEYLYQPHTSAGRVPTRKALQYWMKEALSPEEPSPEFQEILTHLVEEERDGESLVTRLSERLSQESQGMVLALFPDRESLPLQEAKLIPLSERALLFLWITPTERVFHRVITVPFRISPDLLEQLSRILNTSYRGLTFGEVVERLESDLQNLRQDLRSAIWQIVHSLFPEPGVILVGKENILRHPGPLDWERVRLLLEALENREILQQILRRVSKKGEFSLILTDELGVDMEGSVGILVTSFGGESPEGTLGIVRPVCLSYPRLVGHLRYAAHLLDRALGYPA